MVKHTQTISQLLQTNYLSVLDHFVGLVLKGLRILCSFNTDETMVLEGNADFWKKTLSNSADKLLMLSKVIYKKYNQHIQTVSKVAAKNIIKSHYLFPVVIEINVVNL